jgi:hypothetical protein
MAGIRQALIDGTERFTKQIQILLLVMCRSKRNEKRMLTENDEENGSVDAIY